MSKDEKNRCTGEYDADDVVKAAVKALATVGRVLKNRGSGKQRMVEFYMAVDEGLGADMHERVMAQVQKDTVKFG